MSDAREFTHAWHARADVLQGFILHPLLLLI